VEAREVVINSGGIIFSVEGGRGGTSVAGATDDPGVGAGGGGGTVFLVAESSNESGSSIVGKISTVGGSGRAQLGTGGASGDGGTGIKVALVFSALGDFYL